MVMELPDKRMTMPVVIHIEDVDNPGFDSSVEDEIRPLPSSPFLSLPAELRNHTYSYLMPGTTNPRLIVGLLQSCHQIWNEYHSMLIKYTEDIFQKAKEASSKQCQALYDGDPINRPSMIRTSKLESFGQLRNVSVSIPLVCGFTDPRLDPIRPRRSVRFEDVTSDLHTLLSMHLTFVTINSPITFDEDLDRWTNRSRAMLLSMALKSFKRAKTTVEINAVHVIYDFSAMFVGPIQEPGHHPIVVFAKRETRWSDPNTRLKKKRFEMLAEDPLNRQRSTYEDEDRLLRFIQFSTHDYMMRRWCEIVKLSRRQATLEMQDV
jgi:hypothetical protein